MEELFRHRVFKMLMKKGLLSEERVRLLRSWEDSGFNVNAAVRIDADDATGRENLVSYLIRAPFSMNKIRYYGYYSSVQRGRRRRQGGGEAAARADPALRRHRFREGGPRHLGALPQEGLRGRSAGVSGLPWLDAHRRVHRGAARRAHHSRPSVALGCSPAATATGRRRRAAGFQARPLRGLSASRRRTKGVVRLLGALLSLSRVFKDPTTGFPES